MPKYEYHMCVGKFTPTGIKIWLINKKIKSVEEAEPASEYFARLGEEGWKMTHSYSQDTNHFYYFRRDKG